MEVEHPKRSEIYSINFDPTVGSEIKKTRPAIVVQNNIANEHSPIIIVAAISSQFEKDNLYPTEVLIKKEESGLKKDSVVLLNQIRSIDKQRIHKKIGEVEKETIEEINDALMISLGLVEL